MEEGTANTYSALSQSIKEISLFKTRFIMQKRTNTV